MTTVSPDFTDFDIIGDIHGHANDLKQLLTALEYKLVDNIYTHQNRKVLFIGDYIDRGKNVIEVLSIVKSMVDSGNAIALMGNHEYNAICYNTTNKAGKYYREHNAMHTQQHSATLAAFKPYPELYAMYIEWFKTLPLFYEGTSFRAVHACWENDKIEVIKHYLKDNIITNEFLAISNDKSSNLYEAIEDTLKGKELQLPNGLSFKDKDGHKRTKIRIKWWQDTHNPTYASISVLPIENLPKEKIDSNSELYQYDKLDAPVFFGHYWMPFDANNPPTVLSNNTCCIDYSVAKEGKLTCYRYNGEQCLEESNLFYL